MPFFSHVGSVNGSSAIYLGDGWVMTAAHVTAGLPASARFGGTAYASEPGSRRQLANGSGFAADIVVFRLATSPAAPYLPCKQTAGSSPA